MKNFDMIQIYNLEVFGRHGVMEEEQALGQKFLISCGLYISLSRAGKTDNLKDSVNYAEICSFITNFMKNRTFRLIEACCERLCHDLLIRFPSIDHLSLEIKKPWAPIGLPLETVSVKMERGWHTAYIALGSNIGDTRGYLTRAVEAVSACPECTVVKTSDYITTPPYGPVAQDDFLNGCAMIKTVFSPEELLDFLQKIEQAAGRTREIHWGPRTLDLDILLYDDLIFTSDSLTIPHPEMHKRAFVLKPLMQIAPYAFHPVYKKTVTELATRISST